ncbi:MAG TPA: mycofactocin biosynthesis glycosyltransferase MftF [Streptosporangiaceae bacterium]|nr:mycofactocin biosynthesis glycosyltransferase MftF [Streptosporangiaceae bacterium]
MTHAEPAGGGVPAAGPVPGPLPAGFGVVIDPGTKQIDEDTLFGGAPARVLRLSRTGRAALAELHAGPVRSDAAGRLARKLTDTGLAHPRPPELNSRPDVTVLIPVRDRAVLLDRCLSALGNSYPVLVVDDGSEDPGAVAAVAAAHGAALVRRPVNGGPGAARNTGLLGVATDLVAFLDSDCVPEPGWIERLAAHLADPAVAAAAPRMVAVPAGPSWAGRYTTAACCLDLGGAEARVVPGTRVAYVPTAALVVRRAALAGDGQGGSVFDPALRWGEDVDLVWRLHAAGWRIRYEPAARVSHHEPDGWAALLARRFRYGTSAAPLALRHPGQVPPLVLHPWPALTVAGLLAGSPEVAGLGFTGSVLAMRRTVHRAGLPARGVLPAMLDGTRQTWLGIGRYACQYGIPVLATALVAPGRGAPARRWARRAAAASLLLGPPLTAWSTRRRSLDPVRYVLGHLADDAAYGAGVWAGALRARSLAPVRPVIAWHPFRTGPASRTEPPAPAAPPP